ncbi:importin alpha [Anaeramoeba ignava]|uniref:Importin subunit alpha n=1 Tax=Anaeramoeba ignava TaxID=1746090 RepID=A0A9Q0RCY8_ANAIG|nr:importin alpha [Anaeramoeba ignava]
MSFRDRFLKRKNRFKKTFDFNESRGKRMQTAIMISKNKRDEQLMKKRNINISVNHIDSDSDDDEPIDLLLKNLNSYVNSIKSNDNSQKQFALIKIRKIVSVEENPPIQQIIDTGIIPDLIKILSHEKNVKILFEAAWILTNIASGNSNQTKTVTKAGAIPLFVRLLESNDEDVQEQAIWGIANIAGDRIKYRDQFLHFGALSQILNIMKHTTSQDILQNGTWAISNLCRGKPKPAFSKLRIALPFLQRLLQSVDLGILSDAAWAVSYLTNGADEDIEECVQSGIVPPLVKLLEMNQPKLIAPVLRAIGNIVSGTDEHTTAVLKENPIPRLFELSYSSRDSIRKEVCWILSNISAGTEEQIQQFLLVDGIVERLVEILKTDKYEIRKEVSWVLSNAITGGSPEQIKAIAQEDCIESLCNLLEINDNKIFIVVLDALKSILQFGEEHFEENIYAKYLEEIGAVSKIETLQKHSNDEVYEKASDLIHLYFWEPSDNDVDEEIFNDSSFDSNFPNVETTTNTNNNFSQNQSQHIFNI